MIVSLNGMDNSGKSTQAKKLMEKGYPYVRVLHINNTISFNKDKFNFDWWFSPNNAIEFVISLYSCIQERNNIAKELSTNDNIIIYDKVNDFYDTRIISTLMMKGLSYEKAKYLQQQTKLKMNIEDVEDLKIFLNPGVYHKKESFSAEKNEFYNKYLNINKVILEHSNINYCYIETNSIDKVTIRIEEEIRKFKNEKQKIR